MTDTCRHFYDTGENCKSVAAKDRDYCTYHLRYRARLLRMAQVRARNERFDLKLPPLESMFAVQSALTQLAEALAADMIDLKRADKLLAVLRLASRNLLKSDKWPASPYHSDQPGPAVDLAAEYGLPKDLDLNTPPEVAFPESALPSEERNDESRDSFVSAHPMGGIGSVPDDFDFRPDYPITPEYVEVDEVRRTQGSDASLARSTQILRNERRRQFRSERKRYAEIAARINLHRAADKLAEKKLAEKDAQAKLDGRKPPASVSGEVGDGAAAKEATTA